MIKSLLMNVNESHYFFLNYYHFWQPNVMQFHDCRYHKLHMRLLSVPQRLLSSLNIEIIDCIGQS